MNQSKIKYLRDRVNQIYDKRRADVLLQYKKKVLTPKEKLELLKQGKFSIRETINTTWGHNLEDYIAFEDAPEPDFAERDAKIKELDEQRTKLLDEIVLGDENEALSLLRGFENG